MIEGDFTENDVSVYVDNVVDMTRQYKIVYFTHLPTERYPSTPDPLLQRLESTRVMSIRKTLDQNFRQRTASFYDKWLLSTTATKGSVIENSEQRNHILKNEITNLRKTSKKNLTMKTIPFIMNLMLRTRTFSDHPIKRKTATPTNIHPTTTMIQRIQIQFFGLLFPKLSRPPPLGCHCSFGLKNSTWNSNVMLSLHEYSKLCISKLIKFRL